MKPWLSAADTVQTVNRSATSQIRSGVIVTSRLRVKSISGTPETTIRFLDQFRVVPVALEPPTA